MKFVIPRIWPQPTDDSSNWYTSAWWVLKNVELARMRLKSFIHADISSSIAPVSHSPELPVPTPPKRDQPSSGDSSNSDSEEDIGDPDYVFTDALRREGHIYFANQEDVNDLIRDLGLTKSNAELLISRLKQWNLLDESVQVTDQRKRHETFSNFFSRQDGLCFCNNVACLFKAKGITCNPSEWRLFIYSSSRSLKAMLRHNGNNCPSLPMAHSVHLKGDYTSVKMLLSALKYDDYGWEVIGDFKMVSFLMDLQGGFTKFPCFLCLKDSITKT